MNRTVAAAAVVLAVATVGACSSNSPTTTSTALTTTPSPTHNAANAPSGPLLTSAQLRGRLLSLSDMPAGWSSTTDNSKDNDSGDGGCAAIQHAAYRTLPEHAEADFVQGSNLPQLAESLGSGTSAQLATAWSSWQNTIEQCHQLTFSANGQSVTLKLAPMSFPKIGEASTAVAATGSIEGFDFTIDIVAWHTTRVAGDVILSDLGDGDVATLEKVAKTAAAKTAAE
jgi:hypothetical protein